jgi:hypothetical protein
MGKNSVTPERNRHHKAATLVLSQPIMSIKKPFRPACRQGRGDIRVMAINLIIKHIIVLWMADHPKIIFSYNEKQ